MEEELAASARRKWPEPSVPTAFWGRCGAAADALASTSSGPCAGVGSNSNVGASNDKGLWDWQIQPETQKAAPIVRFYCSWRPFDRRNLEPPVDVRRDVRP